MKERTLRAAGFILIFVIMHSCIHSVFMRHHDLDDMGVEYELAALSQDPDILFIGDSRAGWGIVPEMIPGAAKVTPMGETIIQRYYRLKYLFESGARPRIVIMPFDLHTLSSKHRSYEPRQHGNRRMEYGEAFWRTGDPRFLGAWSKSFFIYLGNGVELVQYFTDPGGKGLNELISLRERKRYAPTPKSRQAVIGGRPMNIPPHIVEEHEGYRPFDAVSASYFLGMLDLCKRYNASVVLVRYPHKRVYYTLSSHYIPDQDGHYTMMESLIEGRDVLVLDYHDRYFGKPGYFKMMFHLNSRGRVVFTRELGQDLNEMGLMDEGPRDPPS